MSRDYTDTRDLMKEAVMGTLRGIPHEVNLVLFQGDADRHDIGNTDGDRLVALFRTAFQSIPLSNAKNEVDRKTAFLNAAFSLVNRLTGRYVTVRLLDVSVDKYCPEATDYPLSIIITPKKGL